MAPPFPPLWGGQVKGAGGLKLWVLAGQCYELCFLARNQAAETSETLSPFPFCPSPCTPPPKSQATTMIPTTLPEIQH